MAMNIPSSQYFPHFPRQTAQQLTVDEAIAQCKNVANNVISCFPPAGYTVPQDQDLEFVWNSRLPSFIQKNQVDLRIFRQDDKQQQVLAQYGLINNPDGQVPYRARANDSWWGDSGANWKGQNISHSFYWTISPAGQQSELTQPVFTVVQTTGPSSSSQVASTSTPAATGLPSSDTKHSKISKGAIGGIVAGVVVFLGLIVAAIVLWWRETKKAVRVNGAEDHSTSVWPYLGFSSNISGKTRVASDDSPPPYS